jgi:hypothetical protein
MKEKHLDNILMTKLTQKINHRQSDSILYIRKTKQMDGWKKII